MRLGGVTVTSVRTSIVFSLFAFALALVPACKGKPKHQEPPTNVETSAGSAKGPAAAPNLSLPHGPGTPPDKTTKPIDTQTLEKLAAMHFDGFLWNPRGNDKTITVK